MSVVAETAVELYTAIEQALVEVFADASVVIYWEAPQLHEDNQSKYAVILLEEIPMQFGGGGAVGGVEQSFQFKIELALNIDTTDAKTNTQLRLEFADAVITKLLEDGDTFASIAYFPLVSSVKNASVDRDRDDWVDWEITFTCKVATNHH